MHHSIVILMIQTLAYLLVVNGDENGTRLKGCHNANITLNCTHYLPPRPGFPVMNLKWYLKNGTKEYVLATIYKRGGQKLHSNAKPDLMNRLTLHENGLLEISSLHPDDEGVYKCRVRGFNIRRSYQIDLSVACGKRTEIERKVCVEEDVALKCDAKHRTNPRLLKKISWKKEKILENASSYSKVGKEDGVMVHSNDTLILLRGRAEGNQTFKCHVTKIDKSRPDAHFIKVSSVKCYEDTPQTSAVCGGVLNNPVGTFQSPNFPSAYPANSHCKWTISLPQEYAAIDISLDHVNIEHENGCRHDYIAIYDELGNQFGCRICGTRNLPRKVQVKGRVAVVTFHSDSSVNKSGFKIMYKAARTAVKSVL